MAFASEVIENAVVSKLASTNGVTAITSRIAALVTGLQAYPERTPPPCIAVETQGLQFSERGGGANSDCDAIATIAVHCLAAHRRHDVRRKGGGSANPSLNDSVTYGSMEIADAVFSALRRVALTVTGAQTCELEVVSLSNAELIPGIALTTVTFRTQYQPEL